jgi:hypothetical protein
MEASLHDNHYPVRNLSKGKLGHGNGYRKDSGEMGCESNSEECGPRKAHATFCGGHALGLSLRSGAGADGYMAEMFVAPLGNHTVNGKAEPQAVLSGETSLLDANYQARFRSVSLDSRLASPWSSAEEQSFRSADCCVNLLCMSSVRL